MNTAHRTAAELNFIADLHFLEDNADDFIVNGRYSSTSMLRTLAALNTDLSKAEFIRLCGLCGVHPTTARIQFAASRKISLECGDVTMNPDGSLTDLV